MKTERKTAALRRGMVLLCTLVLSLMAVTLPASAANIQGLENPDISLNEKGCQEGTKPGLDKLDPNPSNPRDSSWTAVGSEITGTVKPAEYKGKSGALNRYQCEGAASSTLTITNVSSDISLLTFSYTNPSFGGTLAFSHEGDATIDGAYRTMLNPGDSVSVTLTTISSTEITKKPNQTQYITTVKLTDIKLESLNRDISVTLAPATNGSYTVNVGSTKLKVGETYSKPATTKYTLSASATPNYVFDCWKVNGTVVSTERTYTTAFANDSIVEAVFVDDPMLSIIQLGGDTTGPVTDYIEVNSDHKHNERGSNHTNVGDKSMNNSYDPPTYFPNSRWAINDSGGISSSTDYTKYGAATGDYQTSLGYSQARASLNSDIIRVKCLENCIISFDSSMTAKSLYILNSGSSDDQYGVFLYYYASPKANETANTIKTHGTPVIKKSENEGWFNYSVKDRVSGTKVVVNKGEYLYLYAYAQTRSDGIFSSVHKGYAEDKYEYNATISNFTVTPNNENCTFKTQNTDNKGNALAGGTVLINGASTSVSKPYTAEKAKGTTLTLMPDKAPTGYTFIGWYNAKSKTFDYTHDTYTVTMTQDWEVNPIYVPAMTITTGGDNGYENATYQYKALDGKMETPDGQYVARGPIPSNGGTPDFYTSLKDAFAAKDNTVFLLAGDIITGDLTIPAGKTLVIPDRFADPGPNLSTGLPEQYDTSASIISYCKVSYSGNLTVNGTLVVNARQSGVAGGVCGRAAGGIGYLSLADGATVTVKSGGKLFGYGLIRGGSISAESGSTVRELMEISDMRSALVMKEIYGGKTDYKVFPFSNFSIKSIESRTTYQTGATLYAQYSVSMEGNNKSTGAAPLFAKTGALFNLAKGTMTKYFDPTTYKTVYRVDENSTMDTGFFSLDVYFAVGKENSTLTINTKDYWVPLNAGFDLRTAGDMTVNGDFKFLPGASLSVEKGGKCTVVNGKSLLFYRLNDYDTRGIVQGIYQKGYSSKIYPVNAVPLPEGKNYYISPTLETVGSARLNVDGEMIVKGGLYVSDQLVSQSSQGFTGTEPVEGGGEKTRQEINQAYFKLYTNGYNVLTGTGTIDMTAVQAKQPEVYEAMTAQNTNDPAWAKIPISPIKGLPENAEADDSNNYQPLNTQATYYGVYHLGNFYTWTTVEPKVAQIVNGANETIYRSLADAVYAYTAGEGYIQMLDDSTEPGFTLDRDVTLDLNGKTVTLDGTLTVAKDCTLSGMDSSTGTGYDTAPSGKIVGTVKGCAPTYQTPGDTYDRYVAIQGKEADNKTANLSFHRFNISVTGYRFELATGDTPQCALFFIGKFQGDDAAKAYLSKLGFTLTDIHGTPLNKDDVSYEVANKDIPPEAEPGDSPVVLSGDAYLFEVYLMRSFNKENRNGYTEEIGATAQATFKNNGTQDSKTQWLSFEDAWKNPGEITEKQKAILDNFLKELDISNP